MASYIRLATNSCDRSLLVQVTFRVAVSLSIMVEPEAARLTSF